MVPNQQAVFCSSTYPHQTQGFNVFHVSFPASHEENNPAFPIWNTAWLIGVDLWVIIIHKNPGLWYLFFIMTYQSSFIIYHLYPQIFIVKLQEDHSNWRLNSISLKDQSTRLFLMAHMSSVQKPVIPCRWLVNRNSHYGLWLPMIISHILVCKIPQLITNHHSSTISQVTKYISIFWWLKHVKTLQRPIFMMKEINQQG